MFGKTISHYYVLENLLSPRRKMLICAA